MGAALAEQHDEWAEARPKGKSGGTEFAQPLLCPTAIITLLLNRFDAQFGSPKIHYVQQRVREPPPLIAAMINPGHLVVAAQSRLNGTSAGAPSVSRLA